jgi:hypothetical protein
MVCRLGSCEHPLSDMLVKHIPTEASFDCRSLWIHLSGVIWSLMGRPATVEGMPRVGMEA